MLLLGNFFRLFSFSFFLNFFDLLSTFFFYLIFLDLTKLVMLVAMHVVMSKNKSSHSFFVRLSFSYISINII
jgi:hypothetical protein